MTVSTTDEQTSYKKWDKLKISYIYVAIQQQNKDFSTVSLGACKEKAQNCFTMSTGVRFHLFSKKGVKWGDIALAELAGQHVASYYTHVCMYAVVQKVSNII